MHARAQAQQAYNAAFARHQQEGTPAAWKAKMDALELLSAKATQMNASQAMMLDAIAACAHDTRPPGPRDAAYSLLADLEEHDRNRPVRDSVEDRTSAEVLRDTGVSEDAIVEVFGYSPTPIRRRNSDGVRL